MKNQITLLLCLVSFLVVSIKAQSTNKVVLRASADEGKRIVIIDSKADTPFDENLKRRLLDTNNYKLFEIEIIEDGSSVTREVNLNSALETPTSIICNDFNGTCTLVQVRFKETEKLTIGKNYVLKINGIKDLTDNTSNTIPIYFKFTPPKPPTTATITTASDGSRKKILVQATDTITVQPNINVTQNSLKISKNSKTVNPVAEIIPAKVIDNADPKSVELQLGKTLSESATHDLVIKQGITDSGNNLVTPKGKIEIAGLPKKPDEFWLNVRLNTQFGVHQKPFFDLFFKYNAQNQIRLGSRCLPFVGNDCYWQPQVTVDIGAGNSKSNNSIIFDLPLRTVIFERNKRVYDINDEVFDGIDKPLANYYGWKKTSLDKGAIFLHFGPKFETDKKFERVNALGTLRLEFKQHRLLGSIAHQKTYLASDLTKDEVKQVKIDTGFTFVPYIGTDFGRKVSAEVVENKKTNVRVVIPQNPIFRNYAGFNSTIEWKWFFPLSLSIEEKLSYLARQETVGVVDATGVFLRKVRGFQHRGVSTFNLFLDNARRYSFNITWENGRKEPLFEYLNKVSSGFTISY